MAKYTWDFLNKYRRDGGLAALPAEPALSSASSAAGRLAPTFALALALVAALQ